jgi:dihydropyrimidine dehydrogenase (NAD+) subunit PreA
MHYGFRIVEDMIDGTTNWMEEKGYTSLDQIRGKALTNIANFGDMNLLSKHVAHIDEQKCIHCNLCYIACEDTAHQCIYLHQKKGKKQPTVREPDCVGCRLCYIVCPVDHCITMVQKDNGAQSKTWNELVKELPQPLSIEDLRKFQHKHGIDVH